MARRELLYGVVREAMVRAGVLSSSYKFKVLSLDARGRQFLVMVDLSHGAGGETGRLAEIELSNWRYFIFGAALVIMMLVRPEGLLPSRRVAVEMHPEATIQGEEPDERGLELTPQELAAQQRLYDVRELGENVEDR